jgi:putative flippase GtrA
MTALDPLQFCGTLGVRVRYLAHAGFSFVGNLGITYFLHDLIGWPTELAFASAQIVLFFGNFWIARHYVFQSVSKSAGKQFGEYAGTSLAFRAGEYLLYLSLLHLLGIGYLAAAALSLLVSFSLKFVVYRKLVFTG